MLLKDTDIAGKAAKMRNCQTGQGPRVLGQGEQPMTDGPEMPSALQVAQALSRVLRAKLADHSTETIELTREEAALCLGLANGVAENLDQATESRG